MKAWTLQEMRNDRRYPFQGTFSGVKVKATHFKNKTIYKPLIKFTNVSSLYHHVLDQLWLDYSKQFIDLGELKLGDIVRFDARIGVYQTGKYPDKNITYKIERPSKVKILKSKYRSQQSLKWKRPSMPDLKNHKNALIGYIMENNQTANIDYEQPYETWYVNQYHEWITFRNEVLQRRSKKWN